jgi:hypothetical protein
MLEFQKYCDFKELMSNIEKLVLSYSEKVSVNPVITKNTHTNKSGNVKIDLIDTIIFVMPDGMAGPEGKLYRYEDKLFVIPSEQFKKAFREL